MSAGTKWEQFREWGARYNLAKESIEWLEVAEKLGMECPDKKDAFGHGSKKGGGGSAKANSFIKSYKYDIWDVVCKEDVTLFGMDPKLSKAKTVVGM